MLGACVSAEIKENENEDRVKIDRNNNLSICLDNVKRITGILLFDDLKWKSIEQLITSMVYITNLKTTTNLRDIDVHDSMR